MNQKEKTKDFILHLSGDILFVEEPPEEAALDILDALIETVEKYGGSIASGISTCTGAEDCNECWATNQILEKRACQNPSTKE